MNADHARRLFALANAFKEGDVAVGGTADDRLRAEARRELLRMTVGDIRRTTLVGDGVTASIERSRDRRRDAGVDALTISQLKATLLGPEASAWAREHQDSIASEAVAAVAKVMTDSELSSVARDLFNPLEGRGVAIGSPHHFGSRIQPNSPGDDEEEILFSILEGLSYGCGDVVLGLNPAADDLETIVRLERLLEEVVRRLDLPTRYCVLSDMLKQQSARARTRIDVGFQSLAGTTAALKGMVGLDADELVDVAKEFDGLYFETGQGSAVTNGADEGVDMVTLEARAYGLARHIRRQTGRRWVIVNDVAGFIGPEVFSSVEQLERACLEDTVMAKLHGLTMGLDVCATFHMGIAPESLRALTARVAERAAPAYLMAVAGNADPMLGYLTTSFREHSTIRHRIGRRPTTAVERRLTVLGALAGDGSPRPGSDSVARLYAAYAKAGGDSRSVSALEDEGRRRLADLQARGFDLGGGEPQTANLRVDAIYRHARAGLYATLDDAIISDAASRPAHVRTAASSRAEYLARPASGERLRESDARMIAGLHAANEPHVQFVISDGLNAHAVNEQLRAVLPGLRSQLHAAGAPVGDRDVVVRNGRVRAGYEIGGLVGAEVVVHLIGERPGTGLNTLSAYITYGRDLAGQPRWSPRLDHSSTTAICGIHHRGKRPEVAVREIAGAVIRILQQRRSGVSLTSSAAID
jgi:ethanolamine ammonia-lyase large subunit